MTAPAVRQARISRVADRYLVFDIEDVVYIRRHHGICAVLTGTMPQNPTQNLFLSLPIELHPEEARLLVDKGAAYIADELKDHLSRLASDKSARDVYLQHLKQQRRSAQQAFDEEKAKVQAMHQDKRKPKAKPTKEAEPSSAVAESDSLFASNPAPAHYPLYKYLNSRGYYTTPGLRFGGDYSVYPGDPFRYHAHYMANGYGWDEAVPMLDLVTSGRLGTAVKKSFLFGAEQPAEGGEEAVVRVFCIEWAGM
ncbi:tRNA-splicing endonuclease subunit [Collariella sp. IMI 366227]|nr:tRNA-splicing endonuclease subunit [Collariella sp. IMI 366227]